MDYEIKEDSQGRPVFCKMIDGEMVYRRVPSDAALDESLAKHMANQDLPHAEKGVNGYRKKLEKLVADNRHDSMLLAWAERVQFRSMLALERYYENLEPEPEETLDLFGDKDQEVELFPGAKTIELFVPSVDLFGGD